MSTPVGARILSNSTVVYTVKSAPENMYGIINEIDPDIFREVEGADIVFGLPLVHCTAP